MIYFFLFFCPLFLSFIAGWLYYSFLKRKIEKLDLKKAGKELHIDLRSLIIQIGKEKTMRESVITEIDRQISRVLDEELMEKFPMIAGLVGKDYLDQLKPVFRQSISDQFPSIIERIANHATKKGSETKEINDIAGAGFEGIIDRIKRDLKIKTIVYFTLIGTAIGGLEMLIYYLLT